MRMDLEIQKKILIDDRMEKKRRLIILLNYSQLSRTLLIDVQLILAACLLVL